MSVYLKLWHLAFWKINFIKRLAVHKLCGLNTEASKAKQKYLNKNKNTVKSFFARSFLHDFEITRFVKEKFEFFLHVIFHITRIKKIFFF